MPRPLPVTTTMELPGYRILECRGVVRGIVVRSPTLLQGFLGGLKTMIGGRIGAYTAMCEQRQKLHAAFGLDDIVDLAAAHGHSLDKATLLRAHGEALTKASDHELKGINNWGDALMHCFGATEAD